MQRRRPLTTSIAEHISIIILLAGVASLAGSVFHIPGLSSLYLNVAPVKALTALAFILSAAALWLFQPHRLHGTSVPAMQSCALAIACMGSAVLTQYIFNADLILPQWTRPNGMFPPGMSLFSAINFSLLGFALLADARSRERHHVTQASALVGLLISFLALIGHLYGSALFYLQLGGASTFFSSLLFGLLAAGFLAARPREGFMALVTGGGIAGIVLRRLLPAAVALPLLLSLLVFQGERAGYFSCAFGHSLFAITNILLMALILFANARVLAGLDRQRRQADEALHKANENLELKVDERTADLRDANQRLRREILERERVTKELRESEQRFRTMVEAAKNVALVVCDITGTEARIADFSPGAERIFGYAREEALGQNALLLHVPEVQARFRKTIAAMRSTGEGLTDERMLVRKSGQQFPALFSIYPIFNEQGNLVSTLSISIDLSTLKTIERELQRRTALLDRIYSTPYFLMAYLDAKFNFIQVNNAFAAKFGGTAPEHFCGRNFFLLFHGQERETIFRNVAARGTPHMATEEQFPYTGMPAEKSVYWNWMLLPVKNAAGTATEALALILVDKTESRRAREKLELMQRELNESRRLSDIGTLAAAVAHELRNPLAAINTACFNIRRKTQPQQPSLEHHLLHIEKKIRESDQIINNLLFYSRIQMPQREQVPLYDVLDEVVSQATTKFHDCRATVTKAYAAIKGKQAWADPVQLREVFHNILNNAFEALVEKEGIIEVQAAYDETGKEFCLSFRDNGGGIAPECLQKLAQPFFTTKARGTGLGLTVTFQIVHLHGGTINVTSSREQGTCFSLRLPEGHGKPAGNSAGYTQSGQAVPEAPSLTNTAL